MTLYCGDVDVIYYESTLYCQPSSIAPRPPESNKFLCQLAVCQDCSVGMPGSLPVTPAGECSLLTGRTCVIGTPSWDEWECTHVCVCVCVSATRTTQARIKEQHMFTVAEQHMRFHSYDQRARRKGTNISKDKVERRLKTTRGNKTTR